MKIDGTLVDLCKSKTSRSAFKLLGMALYLVRHAVAGPRLSDHSEDFQRLLTPAGASQAKAVADKLALQQVERIFSSPALRCTGTVAPLAERLGLKIEIARQLAEAVSVSATIGFLNSLAAKPGDSVLSSHGDVIPAVIWTLAQNGLDIPDRHRCKKASIWELAVKDGDIRSAVYHHPKTFGADVPRG